MKKHILSVLPLLPLLLLSTVVFAQNAPVVSDIPDQTVAEGSTFNTIDLDDYVTDAETAVEDIVWTYAGNSELTVSIVSRVATITIPDAEWNGNETITFTATDDGDPAESDSDAATFTVTGVNDAPVVSDIPDQTVAEGASFTTIVLDNYVTDDETAVADIVWTYAGNSELTVSIVSRVATITIPDAEWNGNETITFTATDDDGTTPLSDSDAATFTVTGVNDAPVVSDIPDQTVAEGASFTTIVLDNYVTDDETAVADIVWTYAGNSELTVSIVSRVATITIPDAEWNGNETITFTATDDDGTTPLSDSDAATFTVTGVNDAPVVSDIPDQTVAEGASFTTIVLDNYVTDDETAVADIVWTYAGNSELTVSIVSRVATITIPDAEWNGNETITFTATDDDGTTPLSDSDAATFTVTGVNDAPVVSDIPDQTVAEGASFTTIVLDNYVTDDETAVADIAWTYAGNSELTVNIVSRVATITIPDTEWNGNETITFTATDDDGTTPLSDSDAATFTVTGENDAPVVSDIPDQTVAEGASFTTIVLDNYVTDDETAVADIAWTYAGNSELTVSIVSRVATITIPDAEWNGNETITFTATDDDGTTPLSDSDAATFTVTGVNDAPVVSDIPDQTVAEGASFTTIVLDNYVTDDETAVADIVWTYAGNSELTVSIVSRVATITIPDAEWNGNETITFTATDDDGTTPLSDSDAATFTVTGVNDAPVVSDIPDQTVAEGASFTTIVLDNYVTDDETAVADIVWTYAGNSELTVSIVSRVATITIPDAEWNGNETITFTATDDDGTTPLSDSDAATFTVTGVNDAPVVSDIPDQTVAEGASFTTIVLDNYVTDDETAVADIAWTYAGNSELTVSIVSRVATITIPDAEWNGNETITFTATDDDGTTPLSDSDAATFTVTGVNDAPVVSDIPDQTVAEGASFTTIVLDNYVTDDETAVADIAWTYAGNSELTVNIVSRVATITIPDTEWNGNETITFTATDDDGTTPLSDSDAATFTVTGVNDAPVVSDIPDQTVAEGASFTTIVLDNYVTDDETAVADIAWTYAGNSELTVSIVSRVATITMPDVNWNGSETITFTATDDDGTTPLSDSDAATFTVTGVNDAPTFTSSPITTATQGIAYSYTASAEDIDGDHLSFRAPTLPLWLTFDTTTHILSGIPGNEHVGVHPVLIQVNDGTVTVDQSFNITVSNINDAPTFTSVPITIATQDVAYSYTAIAEDIDGDYLSFRAPTLPLWLTFDTTTHILSGTPTNDEVGIHNVTITINDGAVTIPQSFTITVNDVNDVPSFTSLPLITATQGALYSYTATAEDPDEDSIIFRATVLPPWLTFNDTTHVLSGTPTNSDVGVHNVTITINDGTVTVDQSFVITVGNENDAPVFTSVPDTAAIQGALYTYTVSALDIDEDTLHFRATTLPVWLTFDTTTHILSGIPADEHVGDHNVSIRVNDGDVDVDQSFIIAVQNANDAPTFISIPDTIALQGSAYIYTASGEDIDGDSLIFRAPVLQAWLTFNDTTHILSGIPGNEDVGDNQVILRINDGTVVVDQSFVIEVGNINDAPTFTSIPDTVTLQGEVYSYAILAEDIDGDTLSFSATTLPLWLTFNDTTHTLSGIPGNEHVGDNNVSIRINDGVVNVDQSFIIEVENANDPPTFISAPITAVQQGALYTYTATAEDIDGDTLTYSAPVFPIWLSFDSSTHVLSGTPGNDHVGINNISLMVNDGTVNTFQSFVINVANVNDPPVFTSTPITEARPGVAYNYTVTALDIDGDNLIYTAIALPGWLTFDPSTQLLSATPSDTDVGDQFVTIRVSDGSLYVDQTFVITVSFGNHAPNFLSDPATTAVVGESYIYTIVAYDLDSDPLTFSAPVLPDWLTFYPETQVISGVPRSGDLGGHDVTIRVSDGTVSADQSFPITVENVNSAPSFTSSPVTSVIEGELYVYYVAAEDVNDDELTFSSILLPDWLVFDVQTGVLHGTPNSEDIGDHNVTLSVSDGDLNTDQNFTITVEVESGVGISDLRSTDFMVIYPNPTNGRFIVELAGELEKELNLEIIDPAGRILIQQEFPPYQLIREEYDLSGRPAGMYFIRLLHDSDQIVWKLILH